MCAVLCPFFKKADGRVQALAASVASKYGMYELLINVSQIHAHLHVAMRAREDGLNARRGRRDSHAALAHGIGAGGHVTWRLCSWAPLRAPLLKNAVCMQVCALL